MENEPKGGFLPVIAVAVIGIGCCLLLTVGIGAVGAALAGWFSGFGVGEVVALAGLAALVVYGVVRLWRASNHTVDEADRRAP